MTTPVAGSTSQPGDHDERLAAAKEASGAFVAYDKFIDDQLHTARRQVRTVDIAVSLTTLGAGTLGFFLLAVLCDHWLLSGGLGTVGRWLALVVYLAGAAAYCWHSLLPLCIRRINPVYAAHAIERSKPTLKNSLINFLLLRSRSAELAPQVYEAIERRAATELAAVPVEATIDRSKLIQIGYVFLGLVLAAAIYKVSSPKDPFLTIGRIVLPWADIAPPTRVTIADVRPGNSTVMRGQRAKISAEVHGVARGQTVQLLYGTDDGQIVDRSVPMQVPSEGYLFQCDLPEGKGGIQQDVKYRVVAGDATSNEFRLTVQAAPTIVIESVDYVYPSYTGMVNQTVDHQGDLKAIEGTQVTLHALANQPIKSAAIDFDSNGSDDQRMTFDDRHATATVTLVLKADRQTPEHTSYQLRFVNVDGKENPQPIRHQIEVTRDVAPEIQFLAPSRDEVELPLDRSLVIEVSAHDPDFALARVAVVGQSTAGQPFERSLLEEPSNTGQPWQGQFRKKLVLVPKKLGLKVGDVLEYWAWAEDNKTPVANRTETIHRQARIVSPSKSDVSPDAVASRDQQSDDQSSSADDKKSGNESDSVDDENAPDDQPEPPKAASERKKTPNPQPDTTRPPGADPKADQAQNQDKADAMQDPPAGDQDRDQAHQQPGDQKQGGDRSDKKQAGKGQSGPEKAGQEKAGQGQSGKGQSGQGKAGKDSAGQEGSGEGESGDASSADGSQGAKGQSGKAGTQGNGSDPSRDKKQQPVAQDGSQDGAAFQEILERQGEQEQGGSGAGARQTTTRRSSTPPANSKPTEQTAGQESPDEKSNDKTGGEKKSGEKKAANDKSGDKEPTEKDRTDKKNARADEAEKNDADKKGTDKKSADGGGTDADGKSAGGDDKKSKHPAKGEKDPAGHSDGKTPAADGQSDGGDAGANEKPSTDTEPVPNGKPTGKKSTPDGKKINQTGDGAGGDQEKNSSDADDQAGSDAGGQTKSGQPGPGKQTPGKQSSGKPAADKQPSDNPSADEDATGQSPTGAKTGKQPSPQKSAGKGGEQQGDDQPGKTKSGGGSQPQGKSGQKPDQKPSEKGKPHGKPGEDQQDQGESGAGQGGADDQQGASKPQGENRPGKKSSAHDNPPDGEREKSADPASPSASDHQSDSEGDQDGDRSGGGKKGPGQKSQQAGQGEPGSQSEAEDGGDTASDPGGQESSDGPGGDRESKKPTGQSGKSAGPGSSQSATRSKPANGDGKDSDKPDSEAAPGKSPSGKSGKAATGRGKGGDAESGPVEPPPATAEQADEANLEFARQATELTIQRLRDQLKKGDVDQELLDRLQWSKQDMERWVSRWEEMFRRSAQQGKEGQAARMELDGALRSLGLRPHATEVSGHRHDDTLRGVKESRRTRPPAEYRDQFRQYMQGISRTQDGATNGRGVQAPRQAAPANSDK